MQRLGDYIKEYSVRNKLDEEIPVYSVTNSNGFCRDYFGKEVASNNKRTYKVVPRNAFAYNPSRINVGSVDYQHYEDRVIVSPLYNVFTVDEKILPQYLYFYLKSPNTIKRIRTVASGSVRDNLKLSMLCEFPIQVPSINRQQNIIEILEKTQRIIDEKNDELEKLGNLIKARFVEMFNSETKRESLQNLSIGKSGYGAASASVSYNPNRPRYIRITDINDDGTLNDDCVCSINKSDDEVFRLQKGDFLFARMGATVGKTYYYREGNQIFAGYLIRFKLDPEKILPEYLYAYTKTEEYLDWVKLNQSGAAQPGINAQKYSSLQIPIADIVEQTEFVYFVKQIDKSKFTLSNELAMCNFYVRLINDSITHSRIDLRMSE